MPAAVRSTAGSDARSDAGDIDLTDRNSQLLDQNARLAAQLAMLGIRSKQEPNSNPGGRKRL